MASMTRKQCLHIPLSPKLINLSKMVSILIQEAKMTHPMIPPATISAGLCTPRYRRLNITDTDPGERGKNTCQNWSSSHDNKVLVMMMLMMMMTTTMMMKII